MPLTAEQIEARMDTIGASDVPALMGFDPYKKVWDVWASKFNGLDFHKITGEDKPVRRETNTLRFGTLAEPLILKLAEEKLQCTLLEGAFTHERVNLTVNPDGVAEELDWVYLKKQQKDLSLIHISEPTRPY